MLSWLLNCGLLFIKLYSLTEFTDALGGNSYVPNFAKEKKL